MWLIEDGVRIKLEQAHEMGVTISAEQQQKFEARFSSDSAAAEDSRILSIAGDKAEIGINGVLTKKPDWMAYFFGGGNTTYTEIASAIAIAESNSDVKEILYAFDTPGGNVDGMFDAMAAIAGTKKPSTAVVNKAASAGFGLASQAGKIKATGKASMFGSIGVMAAIRTDDETVIVTSSNAPKKAPDATTAKGKAVIREQLDAMEDLFIEGIAEGRGVEPDSVRANYGQGAVLLAEEALKRGMIDSIAGVPRLKVVEKPKKQTAKSGITTEARNMDLTTLKAEHPDVYSAAVEEGVSCERDRVNAHLIMGKQSGDLETAHKAIEEGSGMTATLQSTYMAAGMNKASLQARDDDEKDAGNLGKQTDESESAKVVAGVFAQLGVKVEA